MNKLFKDNRGFAVIEIVIVAVVLVAIAGAGFWVVSRNAKPKEQVNTQTSGSEVLDQKVELSAPVGTLKSVDELSTIDDSAETRLSEQETEIEKELAEEELNEIRNAGDLVNEDSL